MKKYSQIIALLFIFVAMGCNKETITNVGKLTSEQTQARLKKFPDLLALNSATEGAFELVSQTTATSVSFHNPTKEYLLGVVYASATNTNDLPGLDAGTLCVDNSCSKIVAHQNSSKGVYYETGDLGTNDVFGKAVSYRLQKNGAIPVFYGSMYVPHRITFPSPNPGNWSRISRTTGQIKWTPDPLNEIGVGVWVHLSNPKTGASRGENFLIDDDGCLNFSDFIKESDKIYSEILITLYRGNGVVATGTDGKKYKLVVYSSCDHGLTLVD